MSGRSIASQRPWQIVHSGRELRDIVRGSVGLDVAEFPEVIDRVRSITGAAANP